MIKKFIPLAAFAFLLGSCEPVAKTGADGYTFGEPQFNNQQVQVTIVTYKNKAELDAAAREKGVNIPELAAFSVLHPPYNICTIHMIDPKVSYEPEFIGHEFAHCVYGQWHTNNESRG